MANENETVEQVCEELYDTLLLFGSEHDRILAAHKRELAAKDDERLTVAANYESVIAAKDRIIAAKDAEITQLKACCDGECERIRLGAEPCPRCHIQTAIDKINSLKSLVKELTDILQKHLRCSGDCEGCMLTKLKYECKTKSDYELVRKAREVLNG